jgi:putative holliday junction resolvase
MMGRSLGLDVGHVRIGVALSDPMGIIASPHSVITATEPEADAKAVAALMEEVEAQRVIVGVPLNLEGKAGPQAEQVLAFVEHLKHFTDREIFTVDERYTTAFAERALIGANVKRKNRKGARDKIAAQQILQSWLDRTAHDRKSGL